MPTSASVINPIFNSELYLNQALDSVLSQASPRFRLDVVVVDDGSRDDTKEISRSHTDKIRYFRLSHCGFLGTVRNYSLGKAWAEIVLHPGTRASAVARSTTRVPGPPASKRDEVSV